MYSSLLFYLNLIAGTGFQQTGLIRFHAFESQLGKIRASVGLYDIRREYGVHGHID